MGQRHIMFQCRHYLLGASSMIVKLQTSRRFVVSSIYYLHLTPQSIEWPVRCWLLWWVTPVRSCWRTMPVMDKRDFLSCNLPHCAQNKHQLDHDCQLEQQDRTGRNKYVLVTLYCCITYLQCPVQAAECRHLVKLVVKEGEKAVTALLDSIRPELACYCSMFLALRIQPLLGRNNKEIWI